MSEGTAPAGAADPPGSTRRQRIAGYGLLAVLAYVPVLLQDRGQVSADTKQYLYTDPGRLMSRALSLWDAHVHLGTVTHQNIGYLFPAGPYYWVFDRLGVPDWVAQRLWLASILFGAGLGVLYLLRTLGTRGPGAPVAAVLYLASPYAVRYSARLSILLVAWAALPWLVAFTARALRGGGWRYPAAFAIAVQVAGSVNGSALIYVGLAPLLFIAFAVAVRDVSWKGALAATARIGALTLATSLWWMAGLGVQREYGLNILRYSETIEVVAAGGVAPEVFRGLGDWFMYGGDRIGPWVDAVVDYTQSFAVIAIGYGLAIACLASAAFVRWRYRAYFVLLVFTGGVIATSLHPYDDPSPLGRVAIRFGEDTQFGLALRNVGRAMPLIMLGLAVLGGVAINALARWRPLPNPRRVARTVAVVAVVLAVVVSPIVVSGGYFSDDVQRPEAIADYWTRAIDELGADGTTTRLAEVPGADFTAYRWGNSVEPVTPGLTERPYLARELIPYGSNPSADLLTAYDRRLQEGLLDPEALAPLQRLMSVGTVLARNDLEWERYALARPEEVAALLRAAPGLEPRAEYGDRIGDPALDLVDEVEITRSGAGTEPAPLVAYDVTDPRALVRGERRDWGILLSGDGDGIVDLAALGLVDWSSPIRYSASFASDRDGLARALRAGSVIVVTDTNRKRAARWDNVVSTRGYTEAVDDAPLEPDSADNRLDLFPGAGDAASSVTLRTGGRPAASRYGAPLVYEGYFRPALAFDGDLTTGWAVGAFSRVLGERIRIDLDEPVRAGEVNLVQLLVGRNNRWITEAHLRFTDEQGRQVGDEVTVVLDDASRSPTGQTVTFPEREFTGLEIEVAADNVGSPVQYVDYSSVGFAEIRIPDGRGGTVTVDEIVRMPTDLVREPAAADAGNPLVYVMTRLRDAPLNGAPDEEGRLARRFRVPTARRFGVALQGRISSAAPDEVVDRVLGLPDAAAGGVTVRASSRQARTPEFRASAAVDGDPATAWKSQFGDVVGEWIEVETPAPVTFDRLDLQLVADGRHSIPTRLRIEAGGESRVVEVPPISDAADENATVAVPVRFAPLTGDRIRITIDAIRPRTVVPGSVDNVPVGLAELGIPGVQRAPLAPALAATCRDDLVVLDGRPYPVRLVGSAAAAAGGDPVTLEPCAGEVTLAAGRHDLVSAFGRDTGIDVDRVVLASGRGGGPTIGPRLDRAALGLPDGGPGPALRMREESSTRWRGTIPAGVQDPFWLVLGESFNAGWRATVDGRDLGPPELVDGFANGWRVPAGAGDARRVVLEWTPQGSVRTGVILSALAALVCLVLLARGRRSPPAATPDAQISLPWAARTDRPSRWATVGVTGLGIVLGAVVVGPAWSVVTGALAYVGMRYARGRVAVALAPAACLGVAAGFVIVRQWRNEYPAIFEWPSFFDAVHWVAVAALALLLVDAVVEYVRERPAAASGPPGTRTG